MVGRDATAILVGMATDETLLPLVRWDPVRLTLSLDRLEDHLRRLSSGSESIRDLRLGGAGDVLEVEGVASVAGARVRVRVELAELRLRRGLCGGRVRAVRALGGVRVPRRPLLSAVERALGAHGVVFAADGIVVLDVRRWLPSELRLTVVAVQLVGRTLELWLGAGALTRLPSGGRPSLPADTSPDG